MARACFFLRTATDSMTLPSMRRHEADLTGSDSASCAVNAAHASRHSECDQLEARLTFEREEVLLMLFGSLVRKGSVPKLTV